MNSDIILITGGTAGIGKAACAELVKTDSTLVLVARDKVKLQSTVGFLQTINPKASIDYIIGDLSSVASVREIADIFKKRYSRLDILINNAGLFQPHRKVSTDGYELTFAVNHLSHFLLTNLLIESLKAASRARIINTSSAAQDHAKIRFDDIGFEKKYSMIGVYCQSKLANVIFTAELARRLSHTPVTVNAFHPGYVKTEFARDVKGFLGFLQKLTYLVARTPEKGAETLVWLTLSEEAGKYTGKLFFDKKEKQMNPLAFDMDLVSRFWKLSEEMTGIKY